MVNIQPCVDESGVMPQAGLGAAVGDRRMRRCDWCSAAVMVRRRRARLPLVGAMVGRWLPS
jgi:hypothetical protein